MRNNLEDWLLEFDIPSAGGQPDPMGMTPTSDPNSGIGAGNPNIANMPQQDMAPDPQMMGGGPPDLSQDPEIPDMPDDDRGTEDFEIWKANYFKETVKAEPQDLLDFMSSWREKHDLQPYQRKFVEDNWNVQLLRMNTNIANASKQIRKNIRQQLDQNNPATSIINHVTQVLDTMPTLYHAFIKMLGYSGFKGELHRKYLAALLGAVQVSSSNDGENIIFNETDYSIKMPTRLASQWGELALGHWSLREDDPDRYLSEPERKRLQEGSPEERDVLRRRIVIESIAKKFEEQAFIIQNVADDGTIHTIGWDLSNSLRGAYVEGKLLVKTRHSDNSEAMIDDSGAIVPMIDLNIYFVRETGEQKDDNTAEREETQFITLRDGLLFLSAGSHTIREAATAMQGCEFKETPWQGNPSDLQTLRRCVYSAHDLLMRQC